MDLIVANTRLLETTVSPLSNSQSRNLPASDELYALMGLSPNTLMTYSFALCAPLKNVLLLP